MAIRSTLALTGDSVACCGSRSNMAGRFLPARQHGPEQSRAAPWRGPRRNTVRPGVGIQARGQLERPGN